MSLTNRRIGKIRPWLLIGIILLFVTTLGINIYIIFSTKNSIFFQITSLPSRPWALVLGTEPVRPDGSVNLHFLNRTGLAAAVYSSGKVRRLLISGNQNNRGFNEPREMEKSLLAKNVPPTAMELDLGGTRTWESARRARDVYHLQQIIIITDAFHAPRAIFLCRHFGIDAVALCPRRDPFSWWLVRYEVKEYVARVMAAFEVMTRRS